MLARQIICLLVCLPLFLTACQDSIEVVSLSEDIEGDPDDFVDEKEQIFITDQTGKRWDITHAVNAYGFVPERFQHGLGPNAIPPILNPEMISPGEPGYPEDNAGFTVLGTSLNSLPRAYSLSVLSRHEIVDETFRDTHVAVAY
ncbi:DUF3179 domain-containing protein [candidate division KSB1 bacterium]|nr:DUF3179 domain-containing protein [candidate division KSB1 bacterium]NIS27526.1 DUF3179 domain-containing protein [candidate division KSB1 bacterium]NIU28244.1 DUF3179 domain-containing protein [candidate division KSB1 bacterium]NIU91129.1 DUF3179 domain-containing protein [candidate division KSB1 bacterium]NIV96925.1 DUF3179 domain-containing protein [candidate division KSB1 bacterium]